MEVTVSTIMQGKWIKTSVYQKITGKCKCPPKEKVADCEKGIYSDDKE